MKYAIRVDNENFNRQIELILNLFLEKNDELIFINKGQFYSDKEIIVIDLQYRLSENNIFVSSRTRINKKNYYFSCNRKFIVLENRNKVIKKGISITLLKLLELITGKQQSWGILTGIRPVKLYHKLYIENESHDLVQKELCDNYLLKENKILLMSEIVKRQLETIPDLYNKKQEVSIYIGIPYCPTKCVYCSFPSYAINRKNQSIEMFLKTIIQEIEIIGKWLQESKLKVSTIYFGGGTPTSLEPHELDQIFAKLSYFVNLKTVQEITVESGRPDTITDEKLNIILKWQANRISVNPQSFSQRTLDTIGRNHTIEEIIEKFNLARNKGIKNINMDLIIGLPGENLNDIKNSLYKINDLGPDSLTIHTMAFKTSSYLAKNKKQFMITDRDEINKMMNYTQNWTQEHGYYPYYLYRQKNILGNLENIGFSKKGKECLYNILMMEEKQTIIALGCGAVSKLIPQETNMVIRIPNPKDPKTYIDSVKRLTSNKIEKLNQILKK